MNRNILEVACFLMYALTLEQRVDIELFLHLSNEVVNRVSLERHNLHLFGRETFESEAKPYSPLFPAKYVKHVSINTIHAIHVSSDFIIKASYL